MNDLDYNKLIKQYNNLINFYTYKYSNGDEDFKQNLTISLWQYIDRKYDPDIGNINRFIKTNIKYLALQIAARLRRDKQLQFENSFIEFCHYLYRKEDNYHIANIAYIIENKLTDIQKRIVYAIDFKPESSYINIAISLGISPRMFYYYLAQIREIFKKYVKYKTK